MARQGSVRYNPYGRHTRTHTRPSAITHRRSRHRTLDPAWTEEYKARIASKNWEQRKDDYYHLHSYRCRGCRRRHNLFLHHKSYARMVKKIGPGTYKRIWAELDQDLVYACRRCHDHLHTIQRRMFPGTHFGLRVISSAYLNTRLFLHYVGYLVLVSLMVATASTGLLVYFSPTTLQRVITCVETRVELSPPQPLKLAACRGITTAQP